MLGPNSFSLRSPHLQWDRALILTAHLKHRTATHVVHNDGFIYKSDKRGRALPDPNQGTLFVNDVRQKRKLLLEKMGLF